MNNKTTKTCSNCETKYKIAWDNEEQDLEPLLLVRFVDLR